MSLQGNEESLLTIENQISLLSMQSLSKVSIDGIFIRNTSNLTSAMFLVDQSELVVSSMRLSHT
jgi:hypothetical protein